MLGRRLLESEVLDVARQDDDCRTALRLGDSYRPVDDELRLHRRRHGLHVFRDVTEELLHVELLLEVAAERHPRLLPDDRDDRLVVALRVVQPVHEMDRTGTGGSDADTDLPGELGVRAGHQRRHLLVGRAQITEVLAGLLRASERAVEPADAVTRVSVEPVEVPGDQAVDDEVADGVHGDLQGSLRCATTRATHRSDVTPRHIRTADGAPRRGLAPAPAGADAPPGPDAPGVASRPRSRRGRTARARREAVRHGAVRPSLACPGSGPTRRGSHA